MIKVGIIGSTGYAGEELVRILSGHKDAEIIWYGSRSYVGQSYADVYGNMRGFVEAECSDDDISRLAKEADVIFTATPQGFLASVLDEEILSDAKVIDLSADFRLKNVNVYEKWYKIEHKAGSFIDEAVYGLSEVNREAVRNARLIANPGCFTTCSILTLYPLIKEHLVDPDSVIIDAKSGTSGAGRGAKLQNLYCEVNESIKPYGVATHRHTPEIEEQLGYAYKAAGRDVSNDDVSRELAEGGMPGGDPSPISFTPHLVPMDRGILATTYSQLSGEMKVSKDEAEEKIRAVYDKYYGDETFIRLLTKGNMPETRWVKGSNYMDIGFTIDERTGRVIAVGAIDNMVKGAAGQAVQNMNIMFGLPEDEGLKTPPLFP